MSEENRYQHRRRFLQSNGSYSHMTHAPRAVRVHVPIQNTKQCDYAIKQWINTSFLIGHIEEIDLIGKLRSFGIILREMHCRLSDSARQNFLQEYGAIAVPDEARVVIPLLNANHFNSGKSEMKKLASYYKKIPLKMGLREKQHTIYDSLRGLSWQLKELADDSKMMPFNPSYDFRGVR